MSKRFMFICMICLFTASIFAQSATDSVKPWEEMVYRTETGTIPDTGRTYTVEIRFSPYSNEAYVTYVILEPLYRETDAVHVIRDVARRFTAEFGYDWYSYSSEPVLWFDNVKHEAHYRANITFRKYFIQKEN